MNKMVKPLIIAASVAAVAGIGAVSFAAWAGNSKTKDVSTNKTGHEDQLGFTADVTNFTDLKPFDQGLTVTSNKVTLKSDNANIKVVDLTIDHDTKNYSVTVKYTTAVPDNVSGSYELWVYVGNANPITSDIEIELESGLPKAGSTGKDLISAKFKKVDTTGVTFGTGTGTDAVFSSSNMATHAYFLLISNDTKDMDKDISITYTVAQVS